MMRLVSRRNLTVAILVAALLGSTAAVAGCTAAGCGPTGDRAARLTRAEPIVPATLGGPRLRRTPSPLTLQDVKRSSPGGEQTVMLQLFYAQWGSWPNVFAMYDPRVQHALGNDLVTSAYELNRTYLLNIFPRDFAIRRTPLGLLVTLNFWSVAQPPSPQSYLLRRINGTWRVAYDTFLAGTIRGTAQARAQERIAPNAKTPSTRAVRAGAAAAQVFRNLFAVRGGAR